MTMYRIAAGCGMALAALTTVAASNPFKSTAGGGNIGHEWGSTSAVYTTSKG